MDLLNVIGTKTANYCAEIWLYKWAWISVTIRSTQFAYVNTNYNTSSKYKLLILNLIYVVTCF